MGVFGVDVSNHNPNFRDFRGWDFAFIKSSEGNGFVDRLFNQHVSNARAAGCLVAAYHYQRDVSAQSQVDLIKRLVPADIPVIIDVEHGSGSLAITREIIRLLRAEGYDSPFLYLPRWYWNQIGRPDLSGLPRLWASWYPDYVARPKEQGIKMVPTSAWADYGNNSVAMMQFTSTPHDMNWYPGTRDELARVLNGGTGGGGIGDDVLTPDDGNVMWAATSDDGHVETYPVAEWIGKSAFRTYELIQDVDQLKTELAEIKDLVEGLSTGTGHTLDQIAQAVAAKVLASLDVDLVARPQGS